MGAEVEVEVMMMRRRLVLFVSSLVLFCALSLSAVGLSARSRDI
jgi:hypothetical protein